MESSKKRKLTYGKKEEEKVATLEDLTLKTVLKTKVVSGDFKFTSFLSYDELKWMLDHVRLEMDTTHICSTVHIFEGKVDKPKVVHRFEFARDHPDKGFMDAWIIAMETFLIPVDPATPQIETTRYMSTRKSRRNYDNDKYGIVYYPSLKMYHEHHFSFLKDFPNVEEELKKQEWDNDIQFTVAVAKKKLEHIKKIFSECKTVTTKTEEEIITPFLQLRSFFDRIGIS